MFWGNECGSYEHETSHLPVVLAGGGGLRMGRYLHWGNIDPPTGKGPNGSGYQRLGPPSSRLLVSIARQFGLDVNQIGNVATARGINCTGTLDRLL